MKMIKLTLLTRITHIFFVSVIFSWTIVWPLMAQNPQDHPLSPLSIETFSQDLVGAFPSSFKTFPFQHGKAEKVYRVEQESNDHFLKARDLDDLSVQTFKHFDWPLTFPNASWKWRALKLPENADERSDSTNDSACGIYVVFGGYTGDILKYVWSTKVPQGTIIRKKNNFYIFVLQSGVSSLNQWITENRNVVQDYQKAFSKTPVEKPSGFGILTDGNATHSPAECDYDDFLIKK